MDIYQKVYYHDQEPIPATALMPLDIRSANVETGPQSWQISESIQYNSSCEKLASDANGGK